ncbi:MAG: arginine--tRNA ligase [Actinomycetota bacterium]|nr:arginine--tRNA ligase [Actinomycetota bacterium]
MIKERLKDLISLSIERAKAAGELKIGEVPEIVLERPKEKIFGDWATNVAMVLASEAKLSSLDIARTILKYLDDKQHFLTKVEVAGGGFINFFLSNRWLYEVLKEVDALGEGYGHSNLGQGQKVQIEFVSANPVGPMHVGHGRWAAVGDTLANIMVALGYEVTREFYINDYGTQMNVFGKSVAVRYYQLLGRDISFPEDGYRGEYIRDIAREIIEEESDKYLNLSEEEREELFRERAYVQVLEHMKKVLHDMGVDFDVWFSESDLHRSGAVNMTVRELRKRGHVYERDGALWLRTTTFGDDKDRVLIRESGEPTYFAADIAYHRNKFERGFEKVINLWGADHHGYVPRMKAAIKALGYPEDVLEVIIGQLVNLYKSGEPVRMSKRTGEMVTLEELLQEVGRDAARYFFLTRSTDSPLDFDIELAKRQSTENPVYYVQYAHARICSIMDFAREKGITPLPASEVDLELLVHESELDLMRKLAEFGEVVERAALQCTPHILTRYAEDLASLFHVFYTQCRVISGDRDLTQARLTLTRCTRIVLRNVLTLLGVSAPRKM